MTRPPFEEQPETPPGGFVSFGARDVPPGEKPALVRGVFDAVAGRYDLMNDLMSGGAHRVWKDIVIARANPQPGELLLDVAGGTGDLGLRWMRAGAKTSARRGGPPASAVVSDINADMLTAGRARRGARDVMWLQADAEKLPFADASADCVTIGFGIRNITGRAAALAEMRRVLRPGGRFLCLEMSHPTTAALEALYRRFSDHVIPALGKMAAGTSEPYRYFVESIRRFPDQQTLAGEMRAAGFARVAFTNFGGGVAALHTGWAL